MDYLLSLAVPAGFLAGLLVRRVYGDTYWYLTLVELIGFAGMTVGGLVMSTWGGFNNRIKTLFISLAAFGAFAIGMGVFGPLADVISLKWIMISAAK